MWDKYQELLDALIAEMQWMNCRAHALEYHMQYYFRFLSEDLVLFCFLQAMEECGIEEGNIHW